MLLPEADQGVGRLGHGLQYLAGGLQRPVRADGDMLPADEIRDIVDMIEHDGNRRVGLIGEKRGDGDDRSEEHTSELQSLMRISYAVFCLKKKTKSRNSVTNVMK